MRSGLALVCLVLVAAFVAGCASTSTSPSASSGAVSATTTKVPAGTSAASSAPPATTSGAPTSAPASSAPPEAPTGAIAASIQRGAAPLPVNFTLTGASPDHKTFTWTFDANGDHKAEASGTDKDLPATVHYRYNATGVFTANLTLVEGSAVTSVVLPVNVTAGVAGGGPIQEVKGSYVTGSQECGGSFGAVQSGTPNVFNNTSEIQFAVSPATWNKAYVATYTSSAPIESTIVAFFDDSGKSAGGTPFPYTPRPGATTDNGAVGNKMTTGFLSSCGGAQVTVDYVVK
ncbi:MAG: hypothetical protein ACYDBQ_02610 [Thermoplasmatota archaeon]